MKLQYRIFLALLFILLVAIFGAQLLARYRGFQPLTEQLLKSRADVVMTIADELAVAEHPKGRAQKLQRRLRVYIELSPKPFPIHGKIRKKIQVDDQEIVVLHGPSSPMILNVQDGRREGYLMVKFPVDIDAPRRNIGVGLLWLGLICGMGSWLLVRWALKPLETATNAMNQIADGDLSHRVSDPIGAAGNAFNRMADRVDGLVSGQRRWLAAMSHELKTPITRLRLQAEQLDSASMMEDIEELEQLVETMVASARLQSEAVPLDLGNVDIEALIMTALGSVELHERNVNLELDDGLTMAGDWDLLLRVVSNILSNISRYTPEDAEIWIQSKREGERLRLQMADNGPGMSAELMQRIFDPFVRGEESRARVTGGLGLGMMLVKQIVERHQGQVFAERHESGGFQVRMLLPLAQAGDE